MGWLFLSTFARLSWNLECWFFAEGGKLEDLQKTPWNKELSDQDRIPLSNINIKQTSDENKEKYQLGDYRLIQYQILQTNITRTVWQTVRRITNKILGVQGFSISPPS